TQDERAELLRPVCIEYEGPGALKHRLFKSLQVKSGGDAVEGRIPLLGNSDVVLSIVRPDRPMDYWYRFAHGDDVIFVHEGKGVLESQYGLLDYEPGDYLVIPTGVMWRILPEQGVEQRMLVVEAHGHVAPPKRY